MQGGERGGLVDRHERVGVLDLDEGRVAELRRQPAPERRSGSTCPRAARRSRPRPRSRAASARRRAAAPASTWRQKCTASRRISPPRSAGVRPARERLVARVLGQPAEGDRQPAARAGSAAAAGTPSAASGDLPARNIGLKIAGGKTSSASHGRQHELRDPLRVARDHQLREPAAGVVADQGDVVQVQPLELGGDRSRRRRSASAAERSGTGVRCEPSGSSSTTQRRSRQQRHDRRPTAFRPRTGRGGRRRRPPTVSRIIDRPYQALRTALPQ